jgi:hypothetical protein
MSSASAKRDIAYVDSEAAERLRLGVMNVRLATYRYKADSEGQHLGFIIEDMPPGSPAVLSSRDRVDLYGYTSMAIAAIQQQGREIAALKAEIERLRTRVAGRSRR